MIRRYLKYSFAIISIAYLWTSCQSSTDTALDTIVDKDKILFIVSNAHHYGDSDIQAMNHFQEIILPHHEFIKAGYDVDFVSPDGGAIAIGYMHNSDTLTKQYLYDEDFMNQLEHTLSPSQITSKDYQAVYYVGGGSAMFTVPESQDIQDITMHVYEENGGVVSALCHGSAGLAHLKLEDGSYLVAGKKVNGFPDIFENMEDPYYQEFPFSIQSIITERGGDFRYSEEGWDGFTVADDRLITGQDPTGAAKVALLVIEKLEELKAQNPISRT